MDTLVELGKILSKNNYKYEIRMVGCNIDLYYRPTNEFIIGCDVVNSKNVCDLIRHEIECDSKNRK